MIRCRQVSDIIENGNTIHCFDLVGDPHELSKFQVWLITTIPHDWVVVVQMTPDYQFSSIPNAHVMTIGALTVSAATMIKVTWC